MRFGGTFSGVEGELPAVVNVRLTVSVNRAGAPSSRARPRITLRKICQPLA